MQIYNRCKNVQPICSISSMQCQTNWRIFHLFFWFLNELPKKNFVKQLKHFLRNKIFYSQIIHFRCFDAKFPFHSICSGIFGLKLNFLFNTYILNCMAWHGICCNQNKTKQNERKPIQSALVDCFSFIVFNM